MLREKGSGSVYQSGGYWVGQIELGKDASGKRKTKRFKSKTKEDVELKMEQYRKTMVTTPPTEKLQPVKTPPTDQTQPYIPVVMPNYMNGLVYLPRMRLSDFMFTYIVNYKKNSIKPTSYCRTFTTYEKHILPYIGKMYLDEITADDIQIRLLNVLNDKGYSFSTIHKAYVLLNETMTHALRKGLIRRNECELVILPQKKLIPKKDIRFFNDQEIRDFIDTALQIKNDGTPKYKNGMYVVTMIYTGLRVGEATALRWQDVDLENGIIYVHSNIVTTYVSGEDESTLSVKKTIKQDGTKTRLFRYVNMTKSAKKYLSELYNIRHPLPSDYLTVYSKELKADVLSKTYRNVCRAAGIVDSQGIHTLRHTCASLLIRNGIDIKVISEMLGHSSVSFTYDTYVHLIEEEKAKTFESLDI